MPDKNLISFNGPQDNGKSVFLDVLDGTGYDDTIKCSTGLSATSISVGKIIGGREDCIDINNHCEGVVVSCRDAQSGGKYVATLKGESKNCTLILVISKHGSEVDIDLGNNSDQGNGYTTGTVICASAVDGSEVTVRVLQAQKPVFSGGGPYRFIFPHPDAWYHGIVVFFFRLFCILGIF